MRGVKGRIPSLTTTPRYPRCSHSFLRVRLRPVSCADGSVHLATFQNSNPDLVLRSDAAGKDGIDVPADPGRVGVPIFMLTAKSDTIDIVGPGVRRR